MLELGVADVRLTESDCLGVILKARTRPRATQMSRAGARVPQVRATGVLDLSLQSPMNYGGTGVTSSCTRFDSCIPTLDPHFRTKANVVGVGR